MYFRFIMAGYSPRVGKLENLAQSHMDIQQKKRKGKADVCDQKQLNAEKTTTSPGLVWAIWWVIS